MKVLGVTGTIGSGKSTVCRLLADMGCPVIDADREAHLTYARGTRAYRKLLATFGDGILTSDGKIDRSKLGRLVFAEPAAREQLNAIVHPATLRRVLSRLARFRSAGHPWAAVEATLLIDAGWISAIDRLWVVATPEDTVIARLRHDRQLDELHIRARMATQMPALRMMEQADDIIYNDGSPDALRSRVEQLWHGLCATEPTHGA